MPEPSTTCRMCGASILVATGSRTGGLCMTCAREEGTAHRLYDVQPSNIQSFVCCECGSKNEGEIMEVLPAQREGDPWSDVARRIRCADCGAILPLFLACRGPGVSLEEARARWASTYRAWEQSGVQLT